VTKVVNHSEGGSVLILVLWVLVLLGFLTGELIDHNREKAFLAANAWESLKQDQAVESVLHLFSSAGWPIPGAEEKMGKWALLPIDDLEVRVKTGTDEGKVDLNQASEAQIREKLLQWLGEERLDEAEMLADAILDWKDPDDLTRTNGAEADEYESIEVDYRPANGPFKLLTELLLVRGVTRELFWGNPIEAALLAEEVEAKKLRAGEKVKKGGEEEEGEEEIIPSLVEGLTIYPRGVTRVSILIKGRGEGYLWVLAFLDTQGGQGALRHLYRTTVAPQPEPEDA
jgi:DNA uptake protein ComE-like DNA-binding protein